MTRFHSYHCPVRSCSSGREAKDSMHCAYLIKLDSKISSLASIQIHLQKIQSSRNKINVTQEDIKHFRKNSVFLSPPT